jgi:hypothetical protein
MIVSRILISLFSLLSGSGDESGLDYSPRLLHREVNAVFGGKEFLMTELQLTGSPEESATASGKFFIIRSFGGENIIAYIGRVNSCRAGGCSNPSLAGADTESEYFDYFILFDSEKKVKLVRVFNYAATHGQEVAVKRWLDQFAGFGSGKPLRVGKEIDAISGATISVYAIVADIQDKIRLISNHII